MISYEIKLKMSWNKQWLFFIQLVWLTMSKLILHYRWLNHTSRNCLTTLCSFDQGWCCDCFRFTRSCFGLLLFSNLMSLSPLSHRAVCFYFHLAGWRPDRRCHYESKWRRSTEEFCRCFPVSRHIENFRINFFVSHLTFFNVDLHAVYVFLFAHLK
jgi:hypothetical protein